MVIVLNNYTFEGRIPRAYPCMGKPKIRSDGNSGPMHLSEVRGSKGAWEGGIREVEFEWGFGG